MVESQVFSGNSKKVVDTKNDLEGILRSDASYSIEIDDGWAIIPAALLRQSSIRIISIL
jgi:hypothetical protein